MQERQKIESAVGFSSWSKSRVSDWFLVVLSFVVLGLCILGPVRNFEEAGKLWTSSEKAAYTMLARFGWSIGIGLLVFVFYRSVVEERYLSVYLFFFSRNISS